MQEKLEELKGPLASTSADVKALKSDVTALKAKVDAITTTQGKGKQRRKSR